VTVSSGPSARSLRALQRTDDLPPELRACVHQFGYAIVQACLDSGVTDAPRIEQLVYEVWQGARQPQQRTGTARDGFVRFLDWVLIQAEANITADRLLWVLDRKGLALVPREPSEAMVEASIAAIADMGLLTKRHKHRVRLRAAIEAAPQHLMARVPDGRAAPAETAMAAALRRARESKKEPIA
jgi:hypothetical protein